uniref:Pectinesterase inhibitor domain-containing protein n=1 Tax=Populus davidiana TaxID=266767 RepID=A0A6M2FCR5_9ROSI
MRSTIFMFFLLSLVFPHFMFHQPLIFVNGDMKLIQETCKNTKYYDLCVSSLKTNATSTKTDTKGLALIMIGVGMANATATSSYLSSQLLSTTPNDPTMKKVLRECADKYGYSANALQDSVQDLATESYDYAYMHVMGASDYPNACRNAFRRYPGLAYPSELARREDGLKHICDVVLGMIDHLGDL